MNMVVLKKYALLAIIALFVLMLFVYLENKNVDYSFELSKDQQLDAQSKHIIKQMVDDKAINFDIYSHKNSAISKKIQLFFIPYKRINQQININFIDPLTQAELLRENAVSIQGEIILTSKNNPQKKIHITELSESAIINAILTLQNQKDEWLVMAEGYGMMSIDDDKSGGLYQLLINLKKKGAHVARMPLNPILQLPKNVKVLMLPNPTQLLTQEMVNWLIKQMKNGVSLWWLTDENKTSQNYLEISLNALIGDKQKIRGNQYSAQVFNYAKHKITNNFNQPIYLSQAVEIVADNAKPLFKTENGTTLAIAKEQENGRLIITGDSDFISNQYINSVANMSMTSRMLGWLFYHDDRVNIPVKINKNTQLHLNPKQLLLLSVVLLLLIPLIFLIIAIKQWKKNRD